MATSVKINDELIYSNKNGEEHNQPRQKVTLLTVGGVPLVRNSRGEEWTTSWSNLSRIKLSQ